MNKQKILELASKIILASVANNEQEIENISEDLAAVLRLPDSENGNADGAALPLKKDKMGFLKFTEKEILKMPKKFRKQFIIDGCITQARKRVDSRYKCSYEIRYRRNGYNISASGATIEAAKENFIKKLKAMNEDIPTVPTTFIKFAEYWLENFHKRKVKLYTYKNSKYILQTRILKRIPDIPIQKILPLTLQKLLDELDDIPRTKEDVYSLLNQIFKAAINHGIITINPLAQVFYTTHAREHGVALTKAEEQKLLSAYEGTPYHIVFAVMLYCGLRPGELPTVQIDGKFIIANNSKRKGGKVEMKRIPITPMLAPFVDELPFKLPGYHTLGRRFKDILPNHKLYDLRTTFQTRCTECGICDAAIGEFMGNSIGKLKDTYTDLSDEFLLKEGLKFYY